MLGIHDHTKNKHTAIEILATFLIILTTALNASYLVTQALPTLETLYSTLLTATLATGAFYGVNTFRARQTAKSTKPTEPHYKIEGDER